MLVYNLLHRSIPMLPCSETPLLPVTTAKAPDASLRVIKKYPNRRLYDTQDSAYITLAEIKQLVMASERLVVRDANGNLLQDGDDVIIIKDLPVKGASKSIKVGTKVSKIRLVEGDHNIDCKVPGFGAMGLKSEFVKKAN